MEIINLYFGKIVFVKADVREDHTVYVAALSSSFQDGRKQYALAFVPLHLAILSQGYLSDLPWVNLQTRTMISGYNMKPQRWEIPKGLDNPMFTAVERSESKTKYMSDNYPLEMVLIHDSKKKTKYQYHSHMNLLAALTTFKCAISLVDSNLLRGQNRRSAPSSQGITLLQPQSMPMYTSPESVETYTMPDAPAGSTVPDGRYTSIGLPEYTIPLVSSAPKKKGETRREMIARPPERGFDDSFEFIH